MGRLVYALVFRTDDMPALRTKAKELHVPFKAYVFNTPTRQLTEAELLTLARREAGMELPMGFS